jgi:adenine-specific DNA-methyltransferase
MYGLFTHLAFDLAKDHGVIGYVTPTSFLSGEYFKNLRSFIRKHGTPLAADFVSVRKDVFEGVLQETMLATYRKNHDTNRLISVNQITTHRDSTLTINYLGQFDLPQDFSKPWILPRKTMQAGVVRALQKNSDSLSSWGFQIVTGQLVWNRHKTQLTDKESLNCYPIIWSESVSQEGTFNLKSEKRNHRRFIKVRSNQDWLLTKKECIVLQRTTAKEQDKRLVAATLPKNLIKQFKALVVENHLNVILPIAPEIPLNVLAALLNSKALNDAFRTISGSVAVSAYELESLPLPAPVTLKKLHILVSEKASHDAIEAECLSILS